MEPRVKRSLAVKRRGASIRRLLALLAVIAMSAPGAALAQDTAAKCQLVQVADWPVRLAHGKILLDGTVNGHEVGIAIDTGSEKTVIFRSSAQRLGLALRDVPGVRFFGFGGGTRAQAADIDEITIAGATRKGMRVFVAGENDQSSWGDLVLGEDFLASVDVEFDLAHKAVRLFQPRGCEGVSLAYWASDGGSSVDIDPVSDVNPKIRLKVEVNGVAIDAMLDSGASRSILDSGYARQVGVTPDTPGVRPSGKIGGIGARTTDAWRGTFATFVIGNERIRDADLEFADFRRVHEERTGSHVTMSSLQAEPMVLGADFIRSHRVLVSHTKHRMYFSYVGGPAFGVAPGGEEAASRNAGGGTSR
jgi:predicted aspartyl protease